MKGLILLLFLSNCVILQPLTQLDVLLIDLRSFPLSFLVLFSNLSPFFLALRQPVLSILCPLFCCLLAFIASLERNPCFFQLILKLVEISHQGFISSKERLSLILELS